MNIANVLPEVLSRFSGDPLLDFRAYVKQHNLKVDTFIPTDRTSLAAKISGEAGFVRCSLPTHTDASNSSFGVFLRVFDDGSFSPLLQLNERGLDALQGAAFLLGFLTDEAKKASAQKAA